MGKDTYKVARKAARKQFREAVKDAWREYRKEVKKQRLLEEHADTKAELHDMGVPLRQIPVVIIETPAQKIKVRREVSRARAINGKRGRRAYA